MRLRFDSFITPLTTAIVVVAMMAGTVTRARQADSAEMAFEAARKTEVVDRDLRGAITKYRDVASRYSSNRAVAANALARLAACYEQLRQPEAQATYQRIVREFADVPAVAAIARTKAAAMTSARAQSGGLAPRRLVSLQSDWNHPVDISSTGLQIVGEEGIDLVIRDSQTGQGRILVAATSTWGPTRPLLSPDGSQVAYAWIPRANFPQDSYLAIAGTEPGAKPGRVVAPGVMGPLAWSPDGRSVLVQKSTTENARPTWILGWVSIDDGSMRVVRSLGRLRTTSPPRLSPDGHFVAYSSVSGSTEEIPRGSNLPQRLFVASLDGTGESEVVKIVGSHSDPVWTPDGSHLLFVSDRSGGKALWSVPIQAGQAVDGPSLALEGFAHAPVAMSQSGTLYAVGRRERQTVTYIAERGPAAGGVVTSFLGGGGDWSPDGRFFAFKPALDNGSEVIVRSMETGAERSYQLANIGAASPHWLGNGGFLVYASPGLTLHFIDAATGSSRRLYASESDEGDRRQFAVPDDGSRIFQLLRTLEPGQPWKGIVRVDPATGSSDQVVTFPDLLRAAPAGIGLDVTPDGSSLVVMWMPTPTTGRLLTMRSDGTGSREIGSPFPADRAPDLVRWTPDGQSILYVTTENNRSRVMRIPASGGTPEFEGIEVAGNIWNIDPSPHGSRLAYSANQPGTTEIWAIDNILSALDRR